MSRTAHFATGLGILVLIVLWCFVGVLMFLAVAAGKDSRGGSIYDSSFIVLYLIFGVGFVLGLRSAFLNLRRALRSPRLDLQPEMGQASSTPSGQEDPASPDERLAHLVKGSEK